MASERKISTQKPDSFVSGEEREAYNLLEKLNIDFERVERIPEDNETGQVYEILGLCRLKNLFLCNAQKTSFYLLVMPADVPFKSAVLSKQLGTSRFSFAPDEILMEMLGLKHGYVSVLGLARDTGKKINLVFDERVLENEYFGCLPCAETSSLKIKTCDIIEKLLAYTGHHYCTVRM